mgnify:CR=1 FL=1
MPHTVFFNLVDAGLTPTGGTRTGPVGAPQARYNSGSNNFLQRGMHGPSGLLVPLTGGEGSVGAVGLGVGPQTLVINEELISAVVAPPEAQLTLGDGGAGGEGAFVVTGNSGLETAGSASIMTVSPATATARTGLCCPERVRRAWQACATRDVIMACVLVRCRSHTIRLLVCMLCAKKGMCVVLRCGAYRWWAWRRVPACGSSWTCC